ncbi:hypothetical protein [Brevibacillus agri]
MLDQMIEGVVDWKNRQEDIGRADGPERLLAAAFSMEKAMASLIHGQSGHTKAFLLAAKTRPKEESIPLLFHVLQSSNLWLEAMMMLLWINFSRIKGMASFFEWENDLAKKPEQAVQAVEAYRHFWTAMYSLALAFLELTEQLMLEMANLRRPSPDRRLAEQQVIQVLELLDDLSRFVLHSSLNQLEGYCSPSAAFSTAFKQRLKDSILPLKKYGEPGGPVRSVVQTHGNYQAPWLNREVFPGRTKSHKVVGQAKKWKKQP